MEGPDFGDVIDLIRKEDARYEKRAYFFLRDALDHTVKVVRKAEAKASRQRGTNHVSGQELLENIREYALAQFGPMAHLVLAEWGITRCEDFGEMVYQLIEFGIFSKTETDSKDDFAQTYTFEDAFVKPFLPKRGRSTGSQVAAPETF